jgi:hypothetical protein
MGSGPNHNAVIRSERPPQSMNLTESALGASAKLGGSREPLRTVVHRGLPPGRAGRSRCSGKRLDACWLRCRDNKMLAGWSVGIGTLYLGAPIAPLFSSAKRGCVGLLVCGIVDGDPMGLGSGSALNKSLPGRIFISYRRQETATTSPGGGREGDDSATGDRPPVLGAEAERPSRPRAAICGSRGQPPCLLE